MHEEVATPVEVEDLEEEEEEEETQEEEEEEEEAEGATVKETTVDQEMPDIKAKLLD